MLLPNFLAIFLNFYLSANAVWQSNSFLSQLETHHFPTGGLCECCNITVVLMDGKYNLNHLKLLVSSSFEQTFRQNRQFEQINFHTVAWEGTIEFENPLKVTQGKVCEEIMGGTSAVVLVHESPEISSVSAIAYALGFYQIPVISTTARESEFSDQEVYPTFLRMLPTWKVQAKAICSLIVKLSFKQFVLIHSNDTDGESFKQTVEMEAKNAKLMLENSIAFQSDQIDYEEELSQLRHQKTTVVLLHANKLEAENLFKKANTFGLTGHEYVWLLTESALDANNLPTGVIGVTIHDEEEKSKSQNLQQRVTDAFHVLAEGFKSFLHLDPEGNVGPKAPNGSPSPCNSSGNQWTLDIGVAWNRHLLTKTFAPNSLSLAFDKTTNTRRGVKHFVINVQSGKRETVGTFEENERGSHIYLNEMKPIRWGGNKFQKPIGMRQTNRFRVVTVEERPFVEVFGNGQISTLHCQPPPVGSDKICLSSLGNTFSNCTAKCIRENENGASEELFCCGLCVDILENLAQMANVTYELFLSKDGTYGSKRQQNESSVRFEWTGLIGELAREERDLAVAALTINSETATVIDFTKPFIYHGITILEKRRPKVSPMDSFLQPFEWPLWICILLSVSVIAVTLYALDKLSPFNRYFIQSSDDPYVKDDIEEPLSFSSAMWFAWGVLLDSGIGEKTPRSLSGRVLGMVWCGFAMIIMASYTANLAAFLVLDLPEKGLTGINDPRLKNPSGNFTYATVVDSNVYQYFKQRVELSTMFRTMETRNFHTSKDAVEALREKKLDAFIYDSFMLEYESGRDTQCQLVTTGEIFGRSAYGIGLPKGSANTEKITQTILSMHENGTMERLDAIWLRQADKHECNQKKEKNAPAQLGLTNMRDVFILVAGGIGLGSILICFEICICRRAKRRERMKMLAVHYGRIWRTKVANSKRKRLLAGLTEAQKSSLSSAGNKKCKTAGWRPTAQQQPGKSLRKSSDRNGSLRDRKKQPQKLSNPDFTAFLSRPEVPLSTGSLKFVSPVEFGREPYQTAACRSPLSTFQSARNSADSNLSSVPDVDKKFFADFPAVSKLPIEVDLAPPPRYDSVATEPRGHNKHPRRPAQIDSEVWLSDTDGGFYEYSAYRPRTRVMRASQNEKKTKNKEESNEGSLGEQKSTRL